jgi:hypothetical protein
MRHASYALIYAVPVLTNVKNMNMNIVKNALPFAENVRNNA